MPTIRVLAETGEITTTEILSRSASIIPDNQDEFEPSIVERVEYDHKGQTSSVTTVCGETENRRTSDEQPDITIEGIITEDQLADAKSLKEGDQITLISDVHRGDVFIRRVTIEQTTDLVSIVMDDGQEKLAFSFQLQLGQPGTGA